VARAAKSGSTDALYFSPADALKRLKKEGDLFEPMLKMKQKTTAVQVAVIRSAFEWQTVAGESPQQRQAGDPYPGVG